MKQKRWISAAAGFLAFCLLLSGCAFGTLPPLLAGEKAAAGETIHSQIDFNTLEYVRPDLEQMEAMIDQGIAMTRERDREKELLELYDEILDTLQNFDTMQTLAEIRHDLDLQDAFYDQEYTVLNEFYTKYDNRMNELTGAILESAYGQAAREAWGGDFVERYEINSRLNSPEIEDLSQQELDLTNRYAKLLAQEYTTQLNGEEVTIGDLDLTTQEGVLAYYEIYERRNRELGGLYQELIPIRVEMAKRLGYDSYVDYAYDLLGRDYTKEDAAAFAQKVKEVLVPVYQQLEALCYYLAQERGPAEVAFEDGLPVLQKALEEEYPEKMSEALSYMLDCNLYEFGEAPNMTQAGYTTILAGYSAPYMLVNTGIYQDPSTLFHEFGHYYNLYLMEPIRWNDGNNLDLAEIHSQAMEVLMFDSYPKLYGEDADLMELDSLCNLLNSVLQGCAEELFQQGVFENPQMTLEEMNALHEQIYMEFFGYPVRYEWVEIHHHFETPFYYISYATSAISALEIWETAEQDRGGAMEIYDKITRYTLNAEYLTALSESGLKDPFDSNCVDQIARAVSGRTEETLRALDPAA